MNFKTLLVGFLSIIALNTYSQSKLVYMASGDAIEKGNKAHDKENYKSALKYYERVHEGDTNYHRAQYEIALTYYAMEDYQKSVDLCLKELKEDNYNAFEFYNLLGNAYDEMDQSEKAIETYTEAIETYSTYYRLYYNRALTYEKMEKWQEAADDYQNSVRLNPFHYQSHYKLAEIAKEEGEYTKAMLCYNSFLLINASGNLEFLAEYNDYLNDAYDSSPKNIKLSTDDYSTIDEIILSKAALDKKYKTPNKLTLPFVKQNYLLFQQLQSRELGDGFWDTYYVPFFLKIMSSDKFNDYIYYSLQSSTAPAIVKVLTKNIKKIQEFPDYAGPMWQEMHSDHTEMFDGKVQDVRYFWAGSSSVEAIGKVKDGEPVGRFHYYYSSGKLNAVGHFDDEGEREGSWLYYYSNGAKSGVEMYKEGNLEGYDSSFYKNGTLKSLDFYKDGKAEGEAIAYNNTGTLQNKVTYTNGEMTGPATYYYPIGILRYAVNYENEELEGEFKEFYDDGTLSQEVNFENGKRSGKAYEYYRNGQKSAELNYLNGELNGIIKKWYPDGTLASEGEYKDGIVINTLKEYNPNGSLSSEENFDEDGKKNGEYKEYDDEGNLNMVLIFKKGDLVAYKIYHRDGTLLKEAKKKGGEFLFENFYSDGTQKAVGVYQPGDIGKNGIWKFYDKNGVLSSESSYANGEINGKSKSFYSNGKKYSTTKYVDGLANGLYVQYYKHGQVAMQGNYIDDLEEGQWISYLSDGTVSSELFYIKGELNGPQKYFNVDGSLDFIDYYKDGVNTAFELFDTTGASYQKVTITPDSSLYAPEYFTGVALRKFHRKAKITHGPSSSYYGNGQISVKGNYWNGNETGVWETYYSNGQLKSKGKYIHGDKDGDWIYYHDNGKKLLEETYAYGDLHGKRVWYHDNGKKDTEKNFEHGVENGLAYYYDGNGVLQHIRKYFYGKIVSYSYNGKDGKPVEMIPITNETCECKSYFPNGKVSREFTMKNGNFYGTYKAYYENGKEFEVTPYEADVIQGTKYTYWDNGKVKTETPYTDDDVQGTMKYYRKDGTLEKTETYVLDNLHGLTKFYNTAGKVTKTLEYFDGALISK
ncbi:tetratricopeptide repeat protein [bacterium SCSIO 12643]|nr:tetratricopeptide repeat protein [bacterium SCSIO 12643]